MRAERLDRYHALTASDGPFPVTVESVDGRPTEVFDRGPATLTDAFAATRAHGNAEALVYRDERWTYEQQRRIVTSLARAFCHRYRLGRGDRVAIAMRNYPEWVFSFWAAQSLGCVVVPLNAWLTGGELSALLGQSAPALLVADAERLERLSEHPNALRGLVGVIGVRAGHPAADSFDDVVADATGGDVPAANVTPDDLATIMFTSGTTGLPKGVLSTHRNHTSTLLQMRLRAAAVAAARPRADSHPYSPATLLTSPLFHIAALTSLTSNAYAGRRVVLMHKWDWQVALRAIEQERIAEISGPPLVIGELVDGAAGGEYDTSSLVSLVCGAAPTPIRLVRDIDEVFGGRVSAGTGYGATETTSTVVTITGTDFLQRPTSVGRALPTVQVRVRGSAGAVAPAGVAGELEISGPQVSPGYWAAGKRVDSLAFADGWYRTGDIGSVDDEGYIYLQGRIKDVVNRAGENVPAAEVESAISAHPAVLESAVVGRPHPALGEEVAAVVRPRPGQEVTADELRAFLAARLAAFKIPTWIQIASQALPRTPTGKIVKTAVVDELRATVWR
jgi:long-chain acyl-CoA synthetase